jgi:hypothetical protein
MPARLGASMPLLWWMLTNARGAIAVASSARSAMVRK